MHDNGFASSQTISDNPRQSQAAERAANPSRSCQILPDRPKSFQIMSKSFRSSQFLPQWPGFSGTWNKFDCVILITIGNGDCPQIFAALVISANICRNVYKNICTTEFAPPNGQYCCKQAAQHVQSITCPSIHSLCLSNWLPWNVSNGYFHSF